MTFTEIVTKITKRLNLTSTTAIERVGETVNDVYKKITTSIGLNVSRHYEATTTASIGSQYVTFTGVEKVNTVIDKSSGANRVVDEVSLTELDKMSVSASDTPTHYAVYRCNAGTVQIKTNANAQTAYTLYGAGFERASVLSGSQEPAFPESFHDIIAEGALYEEYLKLEKQALAGAAKANYEDRMGDLRIFIAKSPQQDIYVGKMSGSLLASGTVSGGSGGTSTGALSYTQTGLITFDRSGAAPSDEPFAVASGANMVPNLDADKVDGEHATSLHAAASLTGTVPVARLLAGVTSAIFPTTTGAQNDWAPGLAGDTFIQWTGASPLAVTGFAGGVTGQRIIFTNQGSSIATFAHNSGSSAAGNKLGMIATSAVTPVAARGYAVFVYNGVSWACVAHEQGAWITPTFAAGTYTASGAMTWTVAGGNVTTQAYRLDGKTLYAAWSISSSSVGGTPSNLLQIGNAAWGGFNVTKTKRTAAPLTDNSVISIGQVLVQSGSPTLIFVLKVDGSNWSASANASGTVGEIFFEVD